MKLVSWNCRGLGSPAKVEAVKDLLKSEPADILMLQETKIEGETLLKVRKLKWGKNVGKAISVRYLWWPSNIMVGGQVSTRKLL